MKKKLEKLLLIAATLTMLGTCACNQVSHAVNPFYEPPSPVALLGSPNDHALNGQFGKEDTARKALEAWGTYEKTLTPKPYHPVIQPAVVRLMWVPDHLNKHNDMVPAHYYYLKVLHDRWGVRDAFELEKQLGPDTGAVGIPYIREGQGIATQ